MKLKILGALFLAGCAVAYAANLPTRVGTGIQLDGVTSNPVPATKAGIWYKSTDSTFHGTNAAGTDVPLLPTLASAYAAGTAQASTTLATDSTRKGLFILDNATPLSTDLFSIRDSASAVKYLSAAKSEISVYHLKGSSGTPTYDEGAAAGSGPTVTGVGNDIAGTITVLTGIAPLTTSGNVVEVTYITLFAAAPHVVISPANAAAAALSGNAAVHVGAMTTALFDIDVGSTALAASTTYKWNYMVIQ